MASVQGFMKRAGNAAGAFLLGVALKAIGYDQTSAELALVTFWGLRFMMYGLPVISALIQALLWFRYDLEKRLPAIRNEMVAQKAEAE